MRAGIEVGPLKPVWYRPEREGSEYRVKNLSERDSVLVFVPDVA